MAGEQQKQIVNSGKTPERITAEFQSLRNEQRGLVNNLSTLENDLKEHATVIDALKPIDENRRCFRLINGVLCERTVKDVLPQLADTSTQLEKHITLVREQLVQKGKDINKFCEDNNIKIRGQMESTEKTDSVENVVDSKSAKNRNTILLTQ